MVGTEDHAAVPGDEGGEEDEDDGEGPEEVGNVAACVRVEGFGESACEAGYKSCCYRERRLDVIWGCY